MFKYVCTVYADPNVVRRSQTVIETCTEDENPFFYIIWSALCVCLREKDICIYELNRCMYSNKLPINTAMDILLLL